MRELEGGKRMKFRRLVIPRGLWGRGQLLMGDGKMCCLGHLGRACGVPKRAMAEVVMPDSLMSQHISKFPDAFAKPGSEDPADLASEINDCDMPVEEKMERIKILFRAYGWLVTFTGKGQP